MALLRGTVPGIAQGAPLLFQSAPITLPDSDVTLTGSQVLHSTISMTPTTTRTITLPSTAVILGTLRSITSGISSTDAVIFQIRNLSLDPADVITIALGTGGSFDPPITPTIAGSSYRSFTIGLNASGYSVNDQGISFGVPPVLAADLSAVLAEGNTTGGTNIVVSATDAIQLIETAGTTDTVTIQAPPTIATSFTLTLPNNDGDANEFLRTDGAGTLSWAPGGGVNFADIPEKPRLLSGRYTTGTVEWTWDVNSLAANVEQICGYYQGGAISNYKRLMFVMDSPADGVFFASDSNITTGGSNYMTIAQVNEQNISSPESDIVIPSIAIGQDIVIHEEFTGGAGSMDGRTPSPINNGNDWGRVAAPAASGTVWSLSGAGLGVCTDGGDNPGEMMVVNSETFDPTILVDFPTATGFPTVIVRRTPGVFTTTEPFVAFVYGSPNIALFHWDGAAFNSLVSGTNIGAAPITDVKLELLGNTATVRNNLDAVIFTYTDPSPPDNLLNTSSRTAVGIRAFSAVTQNVDNFRVLGNAQITVTLPDPYTAFQRTSPTVIDVLPFVVQLAAGFTGVEAQINGAGDWTAASGSLVGSTFTGTLTNVPVGDVTLGFRATPGFSNMVTVPVIVGEVFLIAGQSNAVGKSAVLNTYSGTQTATIFNKDGVSSQWTTLTIDPNGPAGTGSPWPDLATLLEESLGVPIGFIQTALGATGLVDPADWEVGGAQYNDCITVFQAANIPSVRCLLWFQGWSDITNFVSLSDYNTTLIAMLAGLKGASGLIPTTGYPALQMVCGITGENNSFGRSPGDVRIAQYNAIVSESDILQGPVMYDVANPDNIHLSEDGTTDGMNTFTARWFRLLNTHFFSGSETTGPVFSSAAKDDMAKTVTVTFSGVQGGTLVNPDTAGWVVRNNTVAQSITGVTVGGGGVDAIIQLDMGDDLSGTVDVTYGVDAGGYEGFVANSFGDGGTVTMPPIPFEQEPAT